MTGKTNIESGLLTYLNMVSKGLFLDLDFDFNNPDKWNNPDVPEINVVVDWDLLMPLVRKSTWYRKNMEGFYGDLEPEFKKTRCQIVLNLTFLNDIWTYFTLIGQDKKMKDRFGMLGPIFNIKNFESNPYDK